MNVRIDQLNPPSSSTVSLPASGAAKGRQNFSILPRLKIDKQRC